MRDPVKDKFASLALRHFPQAVSFLAGAERTRFRVSVRSDYIQIAERMSDRAIRIGRSVAAYVPDMIRHFDYYHGSAAAFSSVESGASLRIVDFSTPRFHQVAGFEDFAVLCPSMTEPYLTAQQYIDFADLRPGGHVLDLGGYSGLTAIAFSKHVGPTGKVVVLEPDPKNFAAAKINLAYHRKINRLDNVVLLPFAVSGERGSVRFSSEGAMGSAISSIVGTFRGDGVTVEALTLEDLVRDYCGGTIDFIKMDIEGAEESVIASSAAFFLAHSPRLIIEPHMVNGRSSEPAISRRLSAWGYDVRSIEQTGVSLPLVTATPASKPAAVH